MRKLAVSTFQTLDGVMQAPGGPEEDPSGGFAHGGWSVNYWDDLMGQVMDEAVSVPFDLLLGRKTYEIFAAHWPHMDDSMGRILNGARKFVVTSTLKSLAWQNSQRLTGDLATGVRALKYEDGPPEIQVHGSSQLIRGLLPHGLIDEFRVWTFPVVIGSGKRLFGPGTEPAGLALASTRTSTTGVVISVYRPAGALRTGSFALETPSAEEAERQREIEREG
jgi:dihydrofolate reductase